MTNKVDQKTIRSHNLVQWVNEILHWYSKGYRPLTHTIRNMGVQNIIVMEGVASATGDAKASETKTEVLVGLEADENANKEVVTEEVVAETKVEKPVTVKTETTETVDTKQPVKTTRTKKVTKDEN